MSTTRRYEAAIVGGGLAGLAAAAALGKAGLDFVHVAPAAPPDRRTSALMLPSVEYLQRAGLVSTPDALGQPLTQIRIIDATDRLIRAPETLFDSVESGLPAFGWNFPNVGLLAAFENALAALPGHERRPASLAALERAGDHWRLTLSDGAIVEAPLVVGADGKRSLVREAGDFRAREHRYAQSALVADLELGRPLAGCSVEFHYDQGPFTLVPAEETRANLVWIDDSAVLGRARAETPERLALTLEDKALRLFGPIVPKSPAQVFPLSTLTVATAGQNGLVLVGEAAHAFPPIGAQGLNLGLRDVADLARSVEPARRTTPGWAEALSRDYARRRATDLARTGAFVDTLFRSLVADFLPAHALRAGGLWALKTIPPLRRRAVRFGMGG